MLDWKERQEMKKRNREESKRRFMEGIGWSGKEWNRKIVEDRCEQEVDRKLIDIQMQEWNEKLEKLKFAKKIKIIIDKESEIYNKEWIEKIKRDLEIISRFIMGSKTEDSKCWKKDIERLWSM